MQYSMHLNLLRSTVLLVTFFSLALPTTIQARTTITQAEASTRASQLSDVQYTLFFKLDEKNKRYSGRTDISFELSPGTGQDATFIDFHEGKVQSLSINGKSWKDFIYKDDRIILPYTKLKKGNNHVSIQFDRQFNTNGRGLHRFKDPVDGNVYIYSQHEPYSARETFPCFDQPDIKASYKLTVTAPQSWQIISSIREKQVKKSGSIKTWYFPVTRRFSTYVWSLHAGPYHVWEDRTYKKIPLRVMSRQSEKDYVQADFWFRVTRAGFDFFNNKFGVTYPFEKYDQLLVPEFNYGAMENVGAVTFSERYAYRSTMTEQNRMSFAAVILHEMAHMWFGDLVTMKWWDDLWLNESFASFVSYWALANTGKDLDLHNAWLGFFSGMKKNAYWHDQAVTTHPIRATIPDAAASFSIIDGITYGKGGSTLKQLLYYIGEENFINGLQYYFKHHAYQNTTLPDFIAALNKTTSLNLGQWQQDWLQTKGLNVLKSDWACNQGVISRFNLVQEHDSLSDKVLRPHRTRIAFYKIEKNQVVLDYVIPATYSQATTSVTDAIGKPCPAMVFPNHQDYDFVKVILDRHTLDALFLNLKNVPDQLTRSMLWLTLFEAMTDNVITPLQYSQYVLGHAEHEQNSVLLKTILDTVYDHDANRASLIRYLKPAQRQDILLSFEALSYRQFQSSPVNSDLKSVWFNSYLQAARSPSALKQIHEWLSSEQLNGFKLDADRRWSIIQRLACNAYNDIDKIIDAELQKDSSDFSQTSALLAWASVPGDNSKQQWFQHILRNTDGIKHSSVNGIPSYRKMRSVMSVFQQNAFDKSSYSNDEFFQGLLQLTKSETDMYQAAYSRHMYPASCDAALIHTAQDFIKSNAGQLPIEVVNNLKVGIQETEKCINAQSL